MKIIKNNWFPFGDYTTINIFGILFTKSNKLSEKVINHECIHTAQMKELGYIGFYIWYVIEYIIIRFFHKEQNNAYHDVSFEEEAYNSQSDFKYLLSRKHYAFLNYIKIKSSK